MIDKETVPRCPRCRGTRLHRDTQRIPTKTKSGQRATGSWFACLDVACACCFDGVTNHDDGVLPWWVEKRAARRIWNIEEETE